MRNTYLQDRFILRPPRRFLSSDWEHEEENSRVIKVHKKSFSSETSSSIGTSKTENLAALRQELDQVDTNTFGWDKENPQDLDKNLTGLNSMNSLLWYYK